jgi:hypothetical protein
VPGKDEGSKIAILLSLLAMIFFLKKTEDTNTM